MPQTAVSEAIGRERPAGYAQALCAKNRGGFGYTGKLSARAGCVNLIDFLIPRSSFLIPHSLFLIATVGAAKMRNEERGIEN
jgi:hypothetical protein